MSSAPAVFRQVDDPLYTTMVHPAPIGKDSIKRSAVLVQSHKGGEGSLADPLNPAGGGKQVVFSLDNNPIEPLVWNNLAFSMDMVIHARGNTGAHAPSAELPPIIRYTAAGFPRILFQSAPAWNLTGALIRSVILRLNGKEVWKCTGNDPLDFCADFTARLIRNHSWESLNSADTMLFTPIGDTDDTYTCANGKAAAGAWAIPAGASVLGPYQLPGRPTIDFPLFAPAVPAAADLANRAECVLRANEHDNPYATGAALIERVKRWMPVRATRTHVITKIITFADFFPRFPAGMMRNLQKIDIEITFATGDDHMMNTSTDAATQGGVSVINCRVLQDKYTASAPQQAAGVADKSQGVADIIPFLYTEVKNVDYRRDSMIQEPAVSNLDTVMIMKIARGLSNNQAVATDILSYQSQGQFVLMQTGTAPAETIRRSTDEPIANIATTSPDISRVHMTYGSVCYPQIPIETRSSIGNHTLTAQLYHEYQKAVQKLNRRETSTAIPYWLFKNTMPFIMFRPWSDEAPHRSDSQPLNIFMGGGGTAGDVANQQIKLILFRYVVLRISPDGSVEIMD